jgi:hypothetical protein
MTDPQLDHLKPPVIANPPASPMQHYPMKFNISRFLSVNNCIELLLHGAKQEEFNALASIVTRPFLTPKTDRFVDELELFLGSLLNIEAYDEVYMQRLG